MEFGSGIYSLFSGVEPSIDIGAGSATEDLPSSSIDLGLDVKTEIEDLDMAGASGILELADVDNLDSYLGYSPSLSPPDSPPDFHVPVDEQMDDSAAQFSPQHKGGKPVPTSMPAAQPTAAAPTSGQARKAATAKSDGSSDDVPQSALESKSKRRAEPIDKQGADGAPVDQTVKKARRMQKNRESAMLSRQRKKAHLDGLETTNKNLADENLRLRTDKEKLSQKVLHLEGENSALREEINRLKGLPSTASSTGVLTSFNGKTTLMACLMCFAFFGNPAGTLNNYRNGSPLALNRPHAPSLAPERYHTGRTLQSVADIDEMNTAVSANTIPAAAVGEERRVDRIDTTSTTPDHEGQLRKDMQNVQHQIESHFNLSDFNAVDTPTAKGTDLVPANARSSDMDSVHGEWPVPPVFRLRNGLTGRQMRSFRKRTDTSYVFCTEVQIISAASLNEDGIPRMSVLMPGPDAAADETMTESNGTHTFNLVQVDCNVAGSKAIRLGGNRTVVEH